MKKTNSLEYFPNNDVIEAFYKFRNHILDHDNILISYSGGSDSDIMLDMFIRTLETIEDKVQGKTFHIVFFDTGIEYDATKKHIKEVEDRYNIQIKVVKAKKPIPLACIEDGVPFLSKFVSEMIARLQRHSFDFKNDGNKSFEELTQKYKGIDSAFTWWCNKYPSKKGRVSHFNINAVKYLKEFMIENPPDFKISNKCCKFAKKDPSKQYCEENNIDMKCLGLRKQEGGIRTTTIKHCFIENKDKADEFLPVWWFTNATKQQYKEYFGIKYSDCYEKYGFSRTGCAGCPYNSHFIEEIKEIESYEPNLFKAINNIFGKSYEYTIKYRQFRDELKEKNRKTKKTKGVLSGQINMF